MPDIVFNTNNQKILDVLPLEDKETVHVKIFEQNLKSIEVYLDDEQMDCEELELMWMLHPKSIITNNLYRYCTK